MNTRLMPYLRYMEKINLDNDLIVYKVKFPEYHIPYVEIPKERFGDRIISSSLRPAKLRDVLEAHQEFLDGNCQHLIVYDTHGFMYNERRCWICGTGCGLI